MVDTKIETEENEPREIPKDAAFLLGGWLSQRLGRPIQRIQDACASGDLQGKDIPYQELVENFDPNLERITNLLDNLKNSELIEITSEVGGADFVFSETKYDKSFDPKKATIDGKDFSAIKSGLNHNIRNPLTLIFTASQLLTKKGNSERVRNCAQGIIEASETIVDVLDELTMSEKIAFEKNDQGKTKITTSPLLPSSSPSQKI